MALTTAARDALLRELGLPTTHAIAGLLGGWQERWAGLAEPARTVAILFTAREWLLGDLAGRIGQALEQGERDALEQERLALVELLRQGQALLGQMGGPGPALTNNNIGAVGQRTTTAPSSPPAGWPDANSPRYRGDPYRGRR